MEDVAIPFHIRGGRDGRDGEEKWCIADVHDPSKLVEASELECLIVYPVECGGSVIGQSRVVLPSFELSALPTS